ncbi:MAG: helix-turn-helix transcriptional regulator [Paracoccaceae bacterium]
MTQAPIRRHLSDVLADMVRATDIAYVWQIFCDAMVSYRFDKLLYGGTRLPSRGFMENLRETLILHLGPQEYADVYLGEELYLHSPSYEWAEKNSGFASWPEAIRQFAAAPTPEQMRIWQLNAQFGVIAGYVGSLNDVVPGMRGVIGISPVAGLDQAAADRIWAEDGKDVETLCNTMHLRVANLPQTGLLRPLTSRQREVLEWYSQGKTAQDVAIIMDLSKATVEKHLRMARDSLEADTTAHAIKKATSLNLLTA